MSSHRKIGVIDMGTNTFNLLVAKESDNQGHIEVLEEQKVAVKLGEGGISKDLLTDQAMDRGLSTLREFKKKLTSHGTVETVVVATSALRNAQNQNEFRRRIKLETGFGVRIISGQEEAQYILLGARAAIGRMETNFVIMDIGGGSIEFIIANDNQILWMESFEIGAQRLRDSFHSVDPIPPSELSLLSQYLDSELCDLSATLKEYVPTVLVGCAGTFETLSDIYEIRHALKSSRGTSRGAFEISYFRSLYEEFLASTLEERKQIEGMIPLRAEMIVVASATINWLLHHHHFKELRISRYSLKEGVAISSLGLNR